MRVKRFVDFRMAPKKATKGKGVAAEPTRDEGWNTRVFSIWLRFSGITGSFSSQICYPMASCLGFRSSVWKYGGNHCFHLILGMRIGVSLLFFLFWTPALLQDQIASSNPKFLCSYLYLHAFVRSFSGHRAPFRTRPLSLPFEAVARLLCFRCSRRCGSSA